MSGNDSIDFIVDDGFVYINSSHAGPHHGPQANTLSGLGGYGESSTGAHSESGCVNCHMGDATETAGGHTFAANLANCTTCHTSGDMDSFMGEYQDGISVRLLAIAEALVVANALSVDEEEGYHPNKGLVTDDIFKAFWNYMMVDEDHSHGIHNPEYFNTLLTTAETLLGL